MAMITVDIDGVSYSSLKTALAAEDDTYGDLVTDGNEIEFVVSINTSESGVVDVTSSFTTGPSNKLYIRAESGSEIKGTFSPTTSQASIQTSAGWDAGLKISIPHFEISDVHVINNHSSGYHALETKYGATDVLLERCVLDCPATTTYTALKMTGASDNTAICCLARCANGEAFKGQYPSHSFYNCVAVESTRGFDLSNVALTIKNCATMDCTTEYDSAGSATGTKNAGETSTAGDIPGTDSVTGIVAADFVDAETDDYLAESGGALDDAGTDLSATFTTDALGNTITNWPIGINEPIGGGTSLVISDSTHAHTADNLALTQVHVLAVADSAHGHSAENIGLTQNHNLSVNDSSHAHSSDNLALTQVHVLSVNDSSHSHSAGNVALTQEHVLTIDDAQHSHAADNVTLNVQGALEIADAVHGHSAESLNLLQQHNLTIADSAHAHVVDNVVLNIGVALDIADSTHGHTAENLDLTQNITLAIQDAAHALQSANIDLTQEHTLIISDTLHAHLADACNIYDPSIIPAVPTKRVLVINSQGRSLVIAPSTRTLTIS